VSGEFFLAFCAFFLKNKGIFPSFSKYYLYLCGQILSYLANVTERTIIMLEQRVMLVSL